MTPATTFLDRQEVTYRLLSYDHDGSAGPYGQEAAHALGLHPSTVFKTLVAFAGDHLVTALVPVAASLDLKSLARATGVKRATMAEPAVAERATGYVVGGISPFGQKQRLRAYVDQSAVGLDVMRVSGGRRGLEIELTPADLITALGATVAPISS